MHGATIPGYTQKDIMNIVLLSTNPKNCKLWKSHYSNYLQYRKKLGLRGADSLDIRLGVECCGVQDLGLEYCGKDEGDLGVSCFVSPANSFGYMNGGYDLYLAELFAPEYDSSDSIIDFTPSGNSNEKLKRAPETSNLGVVNQETAVSSEGSFSQTQRIIQYHLSKSAFNGYLPPQLPKIIDFLNFENLELYPHHHTLFHPHLNSPAWKKCQGRYILVSPTMRTPHNLPMHNALDITRWVVDQCWNIFAAVEEHNRFLKSKSDTISQEENAGSAIISNAGSAISTLVLPSLGTGYGGLPPGLVSKAMIYSIILFYNSDLVHWKKKYYVMRLLGLDCQWLFDGEEEILSCEGEDKEFEQKYLDLKAFNLESGTFEDLFELG
ncbi:hypothetical protein DASC09_015090 [Saccharomycopsis crataegensis]|uniref:Uncharacterized protein n=1 Tax=Saccharomycopsis crataegensis TaxID=43959 RepID=A0AAV5QIF8_9ASCO|nr:hypothetical protein DASC09_015090 [Saccharomycopsis crataegensis]